MKTAFAIAAFQVKWNLDKINSAVFAEADILVYESIEWTETWENIIKSLYRYKFHVW